MWGETPTFKDLMMKKNQHKKVSSLEHRYRRAIATIRSCRTNQDTKALEVDITHNINYIESYGFDFFPNHYVRDQVLLLEAMAHQLQYATQPTH